MKLTMVLSVAFATLTFANEGILTFEGLGLARRQTICHTPGGSGCRASITGDQCCCTSCTPEDCSDLCKNGKQAAHEAQNQKKCAKCCNAGGESHELCCSIASAGIDCNPCPAGLRMC
uniref:Nectrotrophic effector Tox1 n=1 Tax=Phaeosphaeria nodorum TaxID=13684 RepID=H2E5X7_PHAND|nr:nectrotrophic effector Tox1 [Parastagonospora nodorum]